MKDPLTITNPIERMNDLLDMERQQIVITDAVWAKTARDLIAYYATNYVRKADASA